MPKGEVVVSPVSSYLQASKLITAISRMTGVKAVRLRTYAAGVVTIEVSTETGNLSGFDTAHVDGFPLACRAEDDDLQSVELGHVAGPSSGSGPHADPTTHSPAGGPVGAAAARQRLRFT